VFTAEGLHREAVEALRQGKDVALDCRGLTSIDASAVQILAALASGLAAQGNRLSLSGLSEEMRQTLRLCGLKQQLLATEVPTESCPPEVTPR
jgi:anti-anti-sigma factor